MQHLAESKAIWSRSCLLEANAAQHAWRACPLPTKRSTSDAIRKWLCTTCFLNARAFSNVTAHQGQAISVVACVSALRNGRP
eukprot:1613499-Pyramimonas_sp.AAC.1